MKAILKKPASNGYNYSRDKETVSAHTALAKIRGELREIVTIRAYMGRSRSASTVYASIWVNAGEVYTSGKGSASGWGYHKESAAIQEAITSAGFELYGDVYDSAHSWNYDEKRENTPAEIKKLKTIAAKKRAYIGGVGESAIKAAIEAIARSVGARGKITIVSH
jgi:hypothetical protein